MTSPLHRRLIVLERTSAARSLVLQVFADAAEADAAPMPDDGATVIQIITGVTRSHDAAPS